MNEQEKLARLISVAVKNGFDLELFKSVYKIPVMNNFQLADFLIMTEMYKVMFYDRSFMRALITAKHLPGELYEPAILAAHKCIEREWDHYKGAIEYLYEQLNEEEPDDHSN